MNGADMCKMPTQLRAHSPNSATHQTFHCKSYKRLHTQLYVFAKYFNADYLGRVAVINSAVFKISKMLKISQITQTKEAQNWQNCVRSMTLKSIAILVATVRQMFVL